MKINESPPPVTMKTVLPVSRINTIMKSSSDVEIVSKESSLLMTKAAELFIKHLAKEAYKGTNKGKILAYKNLAEIVQNEERYEFLRDMMPRKITVGEYKKMLARKDRSLNGDVSTSSDSEEDSDSEDDSSRSSD